jgi:hypothetical protein
MAAYDEARSLLDLVRNVYSDDGAVPRHIFYDRMTNAAVPVAASSAAQRQSNLCVLLSLIANPILSHVGTVWAGAHNKQAALDAISDDIILSYNPLPMAQETQRVAEMR